MKRKYKNNMAEYRKAIGKTQQQLALDTGTSDTTIQNIEYGNRIPNLCLAKSIANALKKTVDEIFPEYENTT